MTSLTFTLRCEPPRTTAQQKRVRIVHGRRGKPVPVFFHSAKMQAEAHTWAVLLAPHRPPQPLTGPIALTVRLVYPHLAKTRRADRERLIPKVTKPDASNAVKHLEDALVAGGFMADDANVSRLVVEKWHGPEVGVGIEMCSHAEGE